MEGIILLILAIIIIFGLGKGLYKLVKFVFMIAIIIIAIKIILPYLMG